MQLQSSFDPLKSDQGALYLVPTPIGNLEDMTFRAIDCLKNVSLILAEDTRHTIKLLNHFEIDVPMQSFHEHSRLDQIERFIHHMQQGQSIALVSDAGMPLINDPGHPLVQACLDQDLSVIALPGANAALTALIASGLSSERFTYYGFFPRASKDQEQVLKSVGSRDETAIFYESPFRIRKAVGAIAKYLASDVEVVIAREITKRYEEYLRGTASELETYLTEHPLKGECVLLIEGGRGDQASADDEVERLPLRDHVLLVMANQGVSAKEAIKQVAKQRDIKKQDVYHAYHEL